MSIVSDSIAISLSFCASFFPSRKENAISNWVLFSSRAWLGVVSGSCFQVASQYSPKSMNRNVTLHRDSRSAVLRDKRVKQSHEKRHPRDQDLIIGNWSADTMSLLMSLHTLCLLMLQLLLLMLSSRLTRLIIHAFVLDKDADRQVSFTVKEAASWWFLVCTWGSISSLLILLKIP